MDASSTAQLGSMRDRFVPRAYLQHHPLFLSSVDRFWLIDTDGKRYLDLAGGIGAHNVGPLRPEVVRAITDQAVRAVHSGPVMLHPGYVRLAAELAQRMPGPGEYQTLLVNSGAEAVENAVKIARHATGRSGIIAFDRAFHGRTLLTSALTGKVAPYKSQPGAPAPDIYHAPYPYPYRPPRGVSRADLADHCLEALRTVVATRIGRNHVAAVILECVQGEGGYIVPPREFLEGVERFCREIGALLIVDEIQTGFGRTGSFFAFEQFGLSPDLVVVGKSLAAGLPLAGVIGRREAFEAVPAGDIGGTYGGNPLACVAALAVLELFEREPLLERARVIGDRVQMRLDALATIHPEIGDARGLGAMRAIEFTDPETGAPLPSLAGGVVASAREHGLIVIAAGIDNNVVRLLAPLTIDDDVLDDGLRRFGLAVAAAIDAHRASSFEPAIVGAVR